MLINVLNRMGNVGLKAQKYLPEIAMGVGTAFTIFGTVRCCKDTLKLESIVDNAKEELDDIHTSRETEVIDDQQAKVETTKVYLKTVGRIGRNYANGAGMVIFGLSSMLYGFGVLNGRYVGTVVYAKGLEKAYNKLEQGVLNKYGKDIRDELIHGVTRDDVEYEEIDDEGNSKTRKVKKTHVIPEDYSGYAILFDSSNPNWEKNAAYNLMWLRGIENYMNDLLKTRGHVLLNDVYDALGYPRTPDGAIRGWIYDRDSDSEYISFGIDWEDGEKKPAVRNFLNGLEPNVILEFNLGKGKTSLIWDRI